MNTNQIGVIQMATTPLAMRIDFSLIQKEYKP